jgi:hypothetical protein
MSKFNCLLLTVALSFCSLILFHSEGSISFKKNTPLHNFKIDQSINACAVSINNSYEELINFDKQKRLAGGNFFYAIKSLNEPFLNDNSNYLKACNLLDLNLTTTTIIYPFHSFL